MNTKRTVRGTALGFLALGPVGAALGGLIGSREPKPPRPPLVDTSSEMPGWLLPTMLVASVVAFLVFGVML